MPRKAKWTRRVLVIVVAAGALAGVAATLKPAPIPVQASRAVRGPLVVTVDGTGRTRLADKDTVAAPVIGELARIRLRPGDRVAEGEIVAEILPSISNPLDARSKAELVARMGSARASLSEAERNVEHAEIALELADKEAQRSSQLLAAHAIAPTEVERVESEAKARRAELELARAAVERIRRESEVVAAQLRGPNSPTKTGLQRLDVRAPRRGVVLRVHQESAVPVQPGTPLIDIGDPHSMELVVELPTQSAMRVRSGAPVRVDGMGNGAVLEGEVKLVEPGAFTKVTALGVEEQRVNVIVTPTDRDAGWAALGDGFAADAHIEVNKAKDVLKIPVGAVFREGARARAFYVHGNRVRLTSLDTGQRSAEEVEVRSGVRVGTLVVVHPSDKLQDGALVSVE